MKITRVTVWDVDLGRNAHYRQNPVVLRIDTDAGLSGAGEVGLAYGDAAKAGAAMVENLASSHLIGADARGIESIWDRLYRTSFWAQGGGPVVFGAISAIDQALWDIKGKALDVPIFELLGGRMRDDLPLYANGWMGGAKSPQEVGEQGQAAVARGWRALKLDPFVYHPDGHHEFPRRWIDRDWLNLGVARVATLREAVGDEVEIMLDLHGCFGAASAIEIAAAMRPYRPFFIEEPVDPSNVAVMQKVADKVDIPLAGGERLYTRAGFRPWIEAQALDIVQPDLGLCGGISEARRIAAHAETYAIQVQPHNCGGPVSTAACVQLCAAIPNMLVQEWFPTRGDDRFEIVTDALEPKAGNGRFTLTDAPGLGVALNDDYLSRFARMEITEPA